MNVSTYNIRPIYRSHKLITNRLSVCILNPLATRFYSLKNFSSSNNTIANSNEKLSPHDDKLREIIETTNFGSELRKKKEMHDKKLHQQEVYKKYELDKEAEGEEAKQENEQEEDTVANKDKPAAEDEANVNDQTITASEINQNIQKEIGNLPSQKETRRYQIAKKLEEYLDSLQDTIFTATRALNDVTGYSSIEQLKQSINDLEAQLKGEKENVKKCKDLYSQAILRRSLLQREINELLTRKHNWSPEDLERFTTLYRNDHVNEQEELNTHNALNDAELKVDAIQLKLTQLILTRYHEEQIWSDKIRRASTWGTWILMGINLFLFILATFLVEPWKRKRLVGSFEDKVKQAILEMSEVQEGKWDQMLSQQKESNTHQSASTLTSWWFNSDDQSDSTASSVYPMILTPVDNSWQGFKATIRSHYNALRSSTISTLQFEKHEFAWFATTITVISCALGSILTLYFK
ncbi:Sensitive to high expression protein 9-like protein, mitochondrial [Debaryomyces fabryi]|uniref:Sensitive to high expression protein 9, mitochondrial n=1 Tax=Debaryomyces fabryi TaxID=58627 RepID=A0A0V1Q693_9ASCO|nr:Sensitive to high expression protein 9-like protein, mitochondrial [Debaryomyces fabryi]KSA04033.1 Sensitive to high expression protein 9-like protein, mitochondrial [Debaryomyces fabryi]CUM50304.1 unnamed protein product [Debaryomyces fabryi]